MKTPLPIRGGQSRKKKSGILRETDTTRRDGKWRAEGQLPDEKERHQFSEPCRIVNRLQIPVRTAGGRQSRPQFRPHEPIANDEERSKDPADHGLRSSHRSDDEGNRNEGSDADHRDHVERNRAGKTNSPNQFDRLKRSEEHTSELQSLITISYA